MPLDVGFHEGIAAEAYHGDPCPEPSLSRSIAELMLFESPLHAWLGHPRLGAAAAEQPDEDLEEDPTPAMDFGSLCHALLLGRGASIEVGEFDSFRKKEARAWRDSCRARAAVPVLRKTHDRAIAFAKGAKAELQRLRLFDDFVRAKSEVVAVWKDNDVWLRCMIDKLHLDLEAPQAVIFDVKVTASAAPEAIVRQLVNQRYALQAAFYTRGVQALIRSSLVSFIFLFFSATPPYQLVPVVLEGEWRPIGDSWTTRAIMRWRECMAAKAWPGYVEGLFRPEAPQYLLNRELAG